MAGFQTDAYRATSKISKITNNFDGLLMKQSSAIGYIQGELGRMVNGSFDDNPLLNATISLADTTSKFAGKSLAFFQLDYVTKREKLRDMAASSEIDFVLTTMCNDAIIYDDNGRFCHPADISYAMEHRPGVNSITDKSINGEALQKLYRECFDDIYVAWGFDNGILAWQYLYQYLIEGYLAFEILYDNDNNPTKIIGFKNLDPSTLSAQAVIQPDGTIENQWIQRDVLHNTFLKYPDNKIIYIQYSSHHKSKRISFVESLVRSFNMLRLVEYSKVMWHLMYGAVRLKTEVPVGSKPLHKAQEETREFLNNYKEDIFLDSETGEVRVDGQPRLMFYKNYVIPKNKTGDKIDVSPLEFKGPDLQDDTLLKYHRQKFQADSQLPHSRWNYDTGGGAVAEINISQATQEELSYSKNIDRIRTGFSEILTKPLYIQMCMKNKSIKNNTRVKSAIGIRYNQDNVLEKIKCAEINKSGAETVTKLSEIKENGVQKFDIDFLIKKFMYLTDDDLQENERFKKKKLAKNPEGSGEDKGKEDKPSI